MIDLENSHVDSLRRTRVQCLAECSSLCVGEGIAEGNPIRSSCHGSPEVGREPTAFFAFFLPLSALTLTRHTSHPSVHITRPVIPEHGRSIIMSQRWKDLPSAPPCGSPRGQGPGRAATGGGKKTSNFGSKLAGLQAAQLARRR